MGRDLTGLECQRGIHPKRFVWQKAARTRGPRVDERRERAERVNRRLPQRRGLMRDVWESPVERRVQVERSRRFLKQHLVEPAGDWRERPVVTQPELDRPLADSGERRIEVVVEGEQAAGQQDAAAQIQILVGLPGGVPAVDVTEREPAAQIGGVERVGWRRDAPHERDVAKELTHVPHERARLPPPEPETFCAWSSSNRSMATNWPRLVASPPWPGPTGRDGRRSPARRRRFVRGDDFVVGHEHQRGIWRQPALDPIEGAEVRLEKVVRHHEGHLPRASARSGGRGRRPNR